MEQDLFVDEFIESLYDLGMIQLGSFTLKSGLVSPIYIDLRKTFTIPQQLTQVTELLWSQVKPLHYDLICGVPITGLVFATGVSVQHLVPMIVCRKERKAHGRQKQLEGEFFAGQQCVVIEDLITTGTSLFETLEPLQEESLVVKDIVCLIDREQGGRERLEEKGYRVHSVFKITQILDYLFQVEKITEEDFARVQEYIIQNKVALC